MTDREAVYKIAGAVIMILFLWIFMPALIIWAINTLFGTCIPITIKTWLAAAVLQWAVRPAHKEG